MKTETLTLFRRAEFFLSEFLNGHYPLESDGVTLEQTIEDLQTAIGREEKCLSRAEGKIL